MNTITPKLFPLLISFAMKVKSNWFTCHVTNYQRIRRLWSIDRSICELSSTQPYLTIFGCTIIKQTMDWISFDWIISNSSSWHFSIYYYFFCAVYAIPYLQKVIKMQKKNENNCNDSRGFWVSRKWKAHTSCALGKQGWKNKRKKKQTKIDGKWFLFWALSSNNISDSLDNVESTFNSFHP